MTDRPTRRAAAWLALGLLAALSASFLLPAVPTVAATASIAVENYDFAPASRTIQVGDTVRWTFSGDQHSVTSRDGLFDSGITDAGGSFEFRFTTAGTFRYYCVVHPGLMSGTIVVRAASATPRATVRPTATPRPTPRPTVRATVKPAATPTPMPPPTQTAAPTVPVSPSVAPSPSIPAAASEALVASSNPSNVPPSAAPAPEPAESTSDTTPIVIGGVLLAVVAIGGALALARRRRSI
ncbi:MAG TPA: plastocyanin/azurin family copper-binding protein [Candidatus Limnocylindrales bacterium]